MNVKFESPSWWAQIDLSIQAQLHFRLLPDQCCRVQFSLWYEKKMGAEKAKIDGQPLSLAEVAKHWSQRKKVSLARQARREIASAPPG